MELIKVIGSESNVEKVRLMGALSPPLRSCRLIWQGTLLTASLKPTNFIESDRALPVRRMGCP